MLIPSLAFAQGKISRQSQSATSTTSTKLSVSGNLNGHDYVDLGLPSGRRWATCNIGSKSPAGYGDYFAWAETKPKATYTEVNYNGCADIYPEGLGNIKSDTIRAQYRIHNSMQLAIIGAKIGNFQQPQILRNLIKSANGQ